MADADSQDNTSQDAASQQSQGTSKTDQQLAEIAKMLAEQNQQFQAGFSALVEANRSTKQTQTREEEVDPTYDPKGYKARILDEADKIASRAVARERELNATIYNMAQEYPEISTDAALKKAITDVQRTLPTEIRETAVGYEAAILRAVHKAGLIPKSKRQSQLDEDVSLGSGRSESGTRKASKGKVSEETLMVAELLGRDINDPKILKGLEEASKRTKWSKYE